MTNDNTPVLYAHIQTGGRLDVVLAPDGSVGLWPWKVLGEDGVIWLKEPKALIAVLQDVIKRAEPAPMPDYAALAGQGEHHNGR